MNVKPLIKDEMLVIRVTSAFKATLQRVANEEHRPLGNLVEHVLLGWLAQRGVEVSQGGEPSAQSSRRGRSPRGQQGEGISADASDAPRERGGTRASRTRSSTRNVRAK
jgi:hypothetical protein